MENKREYIERRFKAKLNKTLLKGYDHTTLARTEYQVRLKLSRDWERGQHVNRNRI